MDATFPANGNGKGRSVGIAISRVDIAPPITADVFFIVAKGVGVGRIAIHGYHRLYEPNEPYELHEPNELHELNKPPPISRPPFSSKVSVVLPKMVAGDTEIQACRVD